MSTSLPVTLGTANSQTIIANVSANDLVAPLKNVILTAAYSRSAPPGWPHTPAGIAPTSDVLAANPTTLAIGLHLSMLAAEADALVAAGAATSV